MKFTVLVPPAILLALLLPQQPESGLEEPFLALAGDSPIDAASGHAAPLMVDWDGDGLADLLVGQFSGGRLRIYRNLGTVGAPRFEEFTWFQTEAGEGTVPVS